MGVEFLENSKQFDDIWIIMIKMKKCAGQCGLEKELTKENFQWKSDSNTWQSQCKKCLSLKAKKRRDENKDEIKIKNKIYREKNKEKIALKKKNDYEKNKENINKKSREKRLNNQDEMRKKDNLYYYNNKEKILTRRKELNKKDNKKSCENSKKYYNANKECIKAKQSKKTRNLTDIEKEKINNYKKEWKKNKKNTDPSYNLRELVSHSIYMYLVGNNSGKYNKSFLKYLPYTIDELKSHLESLFEPWMNWDNHGVYRVSVWNDNDSSTWTWQLDHIIPQASLPYASMEDENFKNCWNLKNLRPLSAKQNLLDGSTKIRHKKVA